MASCASSRRRRGAGRCRSERGVRMGLLTQPRRRWRSEPAAKEPDEKQVISTRIWVLRGVILLVFIALAAQLANLQLVRGHSYEQRAQLNQLRIEPVIPSRGLIYDRNGVPLVENVPSFAAAVVAADVPKDRELEIAAGVERL